ncbi:MAG: hypothetical protein Q9209_003622 [Squamulea sp. 1 TL-2023]
MKHNIELLDKIGGELSSSIPISDNSNEAGLLERLMSEVKEDLEYTGSELMMIRESIMELRKEIESESSIQSRMPTMITILAAVYVPLAFVTARFLTDILM